MSPLRVFRKAPEYICAFLLSSLYFNSIWSRSLIITATVTSPIDLGLSNNHRLRLTFTAVMAQFPHKMSENVSPAGAIRSDGMVLSSIRKDGLEDSTHLEDVSITTSDTQVPQAPITWPAWKRNAQILMVAIHSMVCVFMAAGIIPGYEAMAEEYNITVPQASYLTSVQVCIFSVTSPKYKLTTYLYPS